MVLWGIVAALTVLTLGWYSDLRIDYGVPVVAVLAGILLSFLGFLLPRHLKRLRVMIATGERLDGKDCSISVRFAVLAAVLMVYALSVGPVAAITKRGWLRSSTFKQVYAPVIWLSDYTRFRKAIEAYVKLWRLP